MNTKKRPNTVIKTIQLISKEDATLGFVRLCMNNQNNPFLPKIYKAKIYNVQRMDDKEREQLYSLIDPGDTPPDEGQYVMLVVMEKLYPIHSEQNKQTAIQLLRELGVLSKDPEMDYVNIVGTRDTLGGTRQSFDTHKRRQNLRTFTPNPQFRQALRLLEPLFNRAEPDLHKKNIMLRKTAEGPQIVLVDPVISV